MSKLGWAMALAFLLVVAIRLLSDELADLFDVALLVYVGTISITSAVLTARRTLIWTRLGVGVVFSALTMGAQSLHGAALLGGLPLPDIVISLIFDIVRALLLVGSTAIVLGWKEQHNPSGSNVSP